jgi:predicted amidohydrolase
MDPVLGDFAANVATHVRLAKQALKLGADVIAFPELSLTGYTLKDLAAEIAVDPYDRTALKDLLALSKKITIIAGAVITDPDHGIYNAALCIEDGEVIHVHRKIYLPTYGMFEEGRYFSSGRIIEAFDSRHGRFSLLICEDMWHVSLPYLATVDGAEVLFALTASPTRVGKKDTGMNNRTVNYDHQRSYARLLSVYSVFVNRIGSEDGVSFWGGSAAFSPSGVTVAESPMFDEDLKIVHLDSSEVRRARRVSRHVLDERPDITSTNLRRIMDRSERK